MSIKVANNTTPLINLEEKDIITFQDGLYAFENYKHFYLLELNDDGVFQMLQSEDDKDVAFILVNPYLFKRDYVLNVRESDLSAIGIADLEEAKRKLAVFAIVTTTDDTMTANLLGPIVLNVETKQARQALDLNECYTTKHDILQEIQSGNASEVMGVSAG